MARLASETKMGFYQTSLLTIKKVMDASVIFPEDKTVYALDCCAGKGEAIEMLGAEYGCNTYAVELDEDRAKIATARNINTVLNADALSGVRKSNHWVGLNFLNPPYDVSASGSRLEIDFIERWGLTTAIGGVLILVINPSSANEKMATALRVQGYRPMFSFYDPENDDYKRFGQFFMVLHQQLPSFRASLDKFYSLFDNALNINDDIELEKIKIRTGVEPQMLKEIHVPRWKIEKHLSGSRLKKLFFDELRSYGLSTKAIAHPNEGQSALLIASGVLNKKINLANGDAVILKGSSTKFKKDVAQMNEEGEVSSVKRIDAYKTVVYGLNLSHGQFVKYE
ncbi:DUF6094 domain-containing protein [Sulfurimonas sp.]|uniref:DUF6094 domain-containing protein n=1 Tax=Sulfurimonas sp. TaxID=2022749 RepID=UPI0025DDDF72|nr:DUF6094 domain-containing protein [Sulfurimonas sp.]